MRTATETDVLRLAGQLEAAALVLRGEPNCACKVSRRNEDGELVLMPACKSKADHMLRVARQASGFTGSQSSGRSSDVADPTLAAVIKWDSRGRRHEGPEWWQHLVLRDAALISGAVAHLMLLVAELGQVTSTDPKELVKNGQGTCPACDRFCSGAVNDRLISGFCGACYKAWCRAGRPERFGWINVRRVEVNRCKHPSRVWNQGNEFCRLCGEPVEAAS